jgi:tRNA pseudouridine-54 N-methylase
MMNSIILIHPEDKVTVPVHQAITKCSFFEKNPAVTISPYRVQFPVSLSLFREFVTALEGKAVNIMDTNLSGLRRLCEELSFSDFAAKLSEFRSLIVLKEAGMRIHPDESLRLKKRQNNMHAITSHIE